MYVCISAVLTNTIDGNSDASLASLSENLLSHDASPNDLMDPGALAPSREGKTVESWSAWRIFLFLTFISLRCHEPQSQYIDLDFKMMEIMLRYGAHPDVDFVGWLRGEGMPEPRAFFCSIPPPTRQHDNSETSTTESLADEPADIVYFHLHQLVRRYQPRNQTEILKFLVEEPSWDLNAWVRGLLWRKDSEKSRQPQEREQQSMPQKARKIESPDEVLQVTVRGFRRLAVFTGKEGLSEMKATLSG